MAVKTFMLTNSNNANPSALLADGVDQAVASRSLLDKFGVAKVAAGFSGLYTCNNSVGSGLFTLDSTDPKPVSSILTTVTCFMTQNFLTGTFAATVWTFTFAVRATTASAQAGRVRMRVFKGPNVSGAGATELTSAVLVGTTSATLSTTADVTSVITWSPGAITLAAENLFFSLAWEITTAGGSNSCDVVFRLGQAASGTRIVTPDLGTGAAAIIPDVGMALTVT